MKNEMLAHLHDTVQAGKALKTFVAGRTFEHYTSDEQPRRTRLPVDRAALCGWLRPVWSNRSTRDG